MFLLILNNNNQPLLTKGRADKSFCLSSYVNCVKKARTTSVTTKVTPYSKICKYPSGTNKYFERYRNNPPTGAKTRTTFITEKYKTKGFKFILSQTYSGNIMNRVKRGGTVAAIATARIP